MRVCVCMCACVRVTFSASVFIHLNFLISWPIFLELLRNLLYHRLISEKIAWRKRPFMRGSGTCLRFLRWWKLIDLGKNGDRHRDRILLPVHAIASWRSYNILLSVQFAKTSQVGSWNFVSREIAPHITINIVRNVKYHNMATNRKYDVIDNEFNLHKVRF